MGGERGRVDGGGKVVAGGADGRRAASRGVERGERGGREGARRGGAGLPGCRSSGDFRSDS